MTRQTMIGQITKTTRAIAQKMTNELMIGQA